MIDDRRLFAAAVGFARELRAAGLPVGISQTLDFVRAFGALDVADRDQLRDASRAVHVRRHADISAHDAAFDAYWSARRVRSRPARTSESAHRGESGAPKPAAAGRAVRAADSVGGRSPGDRPAAPAAVVARMTYSADEVLRRKDFDRLTADELRQAERLIAGLAVTLEARPARRYELHAHGTRLAPRPMLRRTVSNGGELVEWLWRRRRVVPRPITLLIDVSGSMDAYARLMLRFAHALRRASNRCEVFVFGTRLTRVTRQLDRRSVDEALRRVSAEVADWSGGTRIGACLREYNLRWARRVGSSQAIVVVLSDGWDRGDPELVGGETARLRRNAHRLLWLNPLAGAPDYEPRAAGMAAAARHVDRLLPAGTLADLDDFVSLLAGTRWGRLA